MNCGKCCFPVHCIFADRPQFEDESKLDKDAGRRGHEDLLDDVVGIGVASVLAPLERVVPDGVPGQLLCRQAVQCVGVRRRLKRRRRWSFLSPFKAVLSSFLHSHLCQLADGCLERNLVAF